METLLSPAISYVLCKQLKKYRDVFLSVCGPAREYPRSTVFSRSGEPTARMFFLLEGVVKVYTVNPNGYVRILGYHKKDTIFAMDCLCPDTVSVVTTESITPVRLVEVTWVQLRAVQEQRADFWETLTQYYGEVLRLMCFGAERNSMGDAATRLAAFLCLFRRYPIEERSGSVDTVRLTQEELASSVNASRIQVARICAEFRRKGLIRCERGAVVILEPEKLQELSLYDS